MQLKPLTAAAKEGGMLWKKTGALLLGGSMLLHTLSPHLEQLEKKHWHSELHYPQIHYVDAANTPK